MMRFCTVSKWLLGGLGLVLLALPTVLAAPVRAADVAAEKDADPFVRVVARLRDSVVAVGCYDAHDYPSVRYAGTGFVVDDGRTVVTNAHVVEAVRQIHRLDDLRIFFPDRQQQAAGPDSRPVEGRKATVIAEDGFHDVALLHFAGPPGRALTLSATEPPAGRTIGVMGYPIGTALGLVPAVHKGVVSAVVPAVLPLPRGVPLTPQLAEAIRNPYNLYQLDMVVYPGNSGSPLFDGRNGNVLGIINKTLATATREHLLDRPSAISYAVPARWIILLIHKVRTTSGTGGAGEGKPAAK